VLTATIVQEKEQRRKMSRVSRGLNTVKNLWKENHGASAVEFAIVLPLLLILVFGMIEFGLIIYDQQVITNASREGARFAINAEGKSGSSVQTVISTYCNPDNNPNKSRLISFGTNSPPTTVVKNASTLNDLSSAANVCAGAISANPIDIKVQVSYNYHFLVFHNIAQLFNSSQSSTINLSTFTVMRCEVTS
jgi:Flp pilus assembly protein TadG